MFIYYSQLSVGQQSRAGDPECAIDAYFMHENTRKHIRHMRFFFTFVCLMVFLLPCPTLKYKYIDVKFMELTSVRLGYSELGLFSVCICDRMRLNV